MAVNAFFFFLMLNSSAYMQRFIVVEEKFKGIAESH